METLLHALPEAFPFYHLGTVQADGAASARLELDGLRDLQEKFAVAFRFSGDFNGILITLFDRGLDLSTYTEMGNILASQFATRLSAGGGADVMISPPETVAAAGIARLASAPGTVRRTYKHHFNEMIVPVELLVAPQPRAEDVHV